MGNLSHGVCMHHLIINSLNVQFTHRSHAAQLLSKQGMSTGCWLLWTLGGAGHQRAGRRH